MGTVHDIRPKPEMPNWGEEPEPDGSYQTEAWLSAPMLCVGLEVRSDGERWGWLVSDHDGEGDVCVIVRSGHADSVREAQTLAEAAAAAVLDDAVRHWANRAA